MKSEKDERERRVELTPVDFDPFAEVSADVLLPLTEAQQEMWTACAMGAEASCSYNQCFPLRLAGPLDVAALDAALGRLVARHAALRVTISADGESQTVRAEVPVALPLVDLSSSAAAERDAEVLRLVDLETHTPFDLVNGPLLRATLVREEPSRHLLIVTAHHIVCDGWSSSILVRDLGALYGAVRHGLEPRLAATASYEEYVRAHAAGAPGDEARAAEDWWAARFVAPPPALDLPLDRPRPAAKSFAGAQIASHLDALLCRELRKVGAKNGATLYATALAAFEVLLHRLTGQTDFVVGIPVAGQASQEGGDLVGHCVNTLPLRVAIDRDATFAEHLRAARAAIVDAQGHAELTFGSLVRRLNLPRDPRRTPLVDLTFNVDRVGAPPEFADLSLEPLPSPKSFVNFEIAFNLVDDGAAVAVECAWNSDLLDEATIRRWLGHYDTLLRAFTADPEVPIATAPILTEAERHRIVVSWNATGTAGARETTLHDLVAAQARRTPGAVALVAGTERLTYAELDGRANRVANHLRTLGVSRETPVAVRLDRTAPMIVGILGVLKAGGAYVPIDPAYPAARSAFIVEDSEAKLLLTRRGLAAALPDRGTTTVAIDDEAVSRASDADPKAGSRPGDLAYVIYTSGSTGRPKGVAIEHRSATALCAWARTVFTDDELSGTLAATSICFDLSVFEIFVTLAAGGKVILADNALALPALPAKDEVRLVNTVPSAIAELLRSGGVPASVVTVNLAGEPLSTRLADAIYAAGVRKVYDLYGPSEDTTYSTVALRRRGEPPTIGRPIAGTRLYILDAAQEPVPIGVRGEICLAGEGLARGYLRRPELTAEKFVSDPFAPGATMYRTGDLGRFRPDGNVEFLGRGDHQVKVRGFRIELGEIESVLASHPDVSEVVVIVRDDVEGDRRIVAYVASPRGAEGLAGVLRDHARTKLPDPMVPNFFVVQEELPHTPSGKIDRAALPAPTPAELPESPAPRTPTESSVAAIWAEVLRLPSIGVRDDFFALGGHSVQAAQIMTRLRAAFPLDLPLRLLFQAPTVEGLAGAIDALLFAAAGGTKAAGGAKREEFEL
jgi:amino acid adenylation domain-containing protein